MSTDKLVARQSFTYLDPFDGKRKACHRGRTWVDADHELVRRYPGRFGADDTYPARSQWFERLCHKAA